MTDNKSVHHNPNVRYINLNWAALITWLSHITCSRSQHDCRASIFRHAWLGQAGVPFNYPIPIESIHWILAFFLWILSIILICYPFEKLIYSLSSLFFNPITSYNFTDTGFIYNIVWEHT